MLSNSILGTHRPWALDHVPQVYTAYPLVVQFNFIIMFDPTVYVASYCSVICQQVWHNQFKLRKNTLVSVIYIQNGSTYNAVCFHLMHDVNYAMAIILRILPRTQTYKYRNPRNV